MRELACDVAVVGAGPAGLAAAAAASAAGAEVVVLDEGPAPGGQIWRASLAGGTRPEAARLRERAARARFVHGVAVHDATCDGALLLRAHGRVEGALAVRSCRVVLATGAQERFLPFPGWTLPGVFGVGGLQALVKGGYDVRGRRVLVAGSGPLLLAVAASLVDAGARVVGVLEQAPRARVARFALSLARWPRKLAQAAGLAARLRGVPLRHGAWIAHVARGGEALTAALSDGRTLEVDDVACGFGLVPLTQVGELLGARRGAAGLVVDADLRTTASGVLAAGEAAGIGGVEVALAEGALAGLVAAREAVPTARVEARTLARARARAVRERRFAGALARAYALRPELAALPAADTVVCRCEDVPLGALRGFDGARAAKLATRCGMGPCQARVCGPALELLCGWPRESPRPPLVPVPFAALAEAPSAPGAPSSPPGSPQESPPCSGKV